MNHEWSIKDICRFCGIAKEDYLNSSEWYVMFCSGENSTSPAKRSCCEFPSRVNIGGKWICETCDGHAKKCICVIETLMREGCKCYGK